jgi:hypothetical protein
VALAKYQEFTATGADFRGVIFLISDGNDEGSQATVQQVKDVISPLLQKELFGFIALGIEDGSTDFRLIFTAMGIPPEWILTVDSDGHAIRDACGVVSRATQAASQSGGSLSQYSGLGQFKD